MQSDSVRTASRADTAAVIRTVTLGFSSDPIARWLWPETDVYLSAMPIFIEHFTGSAFEHETALVTDNYRAAALWLRPDASANDDAIDALLDATVSRNQADDTQSFFGQMAAFHPHEQPCWYLPMIATDPAHQGCGIGSVLMERALQRCDAESLPAYLEASSPRSVPLYERHGFAVIGEIQAGSSPVMYPMLREAAW